VSLAEARRIAVRSQLLDGSRLLWEERALVEWRAFLWPAEDLPLLQARMRSSRAGKAGGPRANDVRANAGFRRYVLRELEARGPLLSREIENHSVAGA
jgi:uncharacterized protein YcaQ